VKDIAADAAKDWVTWGLAGLGITTYPYHEWLGGMLLAMAGAAFALRSDPEQDRRELWVVILGAFLAAHVAAMIAARYAPTLPLQLVMVTTGFFSRRLARLSLAVFGKVETRSGKIADRVIDAVLPGQGGGPDKGDAP
jgi:hypothetical protein